MIPCPVCKTKMKTKNSYLSGGRKVIRYRECPNCNEKRITEEMLRDDIPFRMSDIEACLFDIIKTIKKYGYEV